MTVREARRLSPGIYRLHWKDCGFSVATVGMLYSGERWFAPSNWTAPSTDGIVSTKWSMVDRVHKIETND